MNPPTSCRPSSALYEATVLHERFGPRKHRFVYRLFYFYLDLDDLAELDRRLTFFSVNRANVFSFREADFLPTDETAHLPERPIPSSIHKPSSLKERVLAFCAAYGVRLGPTARVTLVTLPRLFGHHFNPVSFYFCFDESGSPVAAVAEVTNTFREVKPYFIPIDQAGGRRFRLRVPKHFYVSPFSPLDLAFDFTLGLPGERLGVRIDSHGPEGRVVHTALSCARRPLGNGILAWFLAKYPFITLKIIAMIHWEAFRLWLKRVPFIRKADDPDKQRGLFRPDDSLVEPPPAAPAHPRLTTP